MKHTRPSMRALASLIAIIALFNLTFMPTYARPSKPGSSSDGTYSINHIDIAQQSGSQAIAVPSDATVVCTLADGSTVSPTRNGTSTDGTGTEQWRYSFSGSGYYIADTSDTNSGQVVTVTVTYTVDSQPFVYVLTGFTGLKAGYDNCPGREGLDIEVLGSSAKDYYFYKVNCEHYLDGALVYTDTSGYVSQIEASSVSVTAETARSHEGTNYDLTSTASVYTNVDISSSRNVAANFVTITLRYEHNTPTPPDRYYVVNNHYTAVIDGASSTITKPGAVQTTTDTSVEIPTDATDIADDDYVYSHVSGGGDQTILSTDPENPTVFDVYYSHEYTTPVYYYIIANQYTAIIDGVSSTHTTYSSTLSSKGVSLVHIPQDAFDAPHDDHTYTHISGGGEQTVLSTDAENPSILTVRYSYSYTTPVYYYVVNEHYTATIDGVSTTTTKTGEVQSSRNEPNVTIPVDVTDIADNDYVYSHVSGGGDQTILSTDPETPTVFDVYYEYNYTTPVAPDEPVTSFARFCLRFLNSQGEEITREFDTLPEDAVFEVTLDATEFVRADLVFIGWSNTPDGEIEYLPGDVISLNALMPELSIYAVWTEPDEPPAITLHGNGGFMEDGITVTYTEDRTGIIAIPNVFVRDDYVFVGWAITPDGDVKYEPCDEIDIVDEDVPRALYAIWKPAAPEQTLPQAGVNLALYGLPMALGAMLVLLGAIMRRKSAHRD